ncbi:TetR/AcrR family transcriptional regulator C-terminal domain-containing protein [Saccharibacillus sp. CPCC 101409]|uniref:TetR/AcrR family transcriptional regulator n=1 Tax=Saccharibacillus sp. CPCC 101409 TaxID=3058041 RepID=UPI002672C519|nr:TetR/AcrR family transcriptional regulator [Saccharibacillus sp. CPCC 101409]MDO3410300.1 TetR/AcrR family transcriptional regulator C-terminal domain-containing protein [Saccharibacillus sp. CPCC 101409]
MEHRGAETEDRRVVRTRKLIEQTLLEMMAERGFKDLNVKNLAQKANINRGTFYLHYRDLYDLIEQTEVMNGLLDIFKPISLGQLRLYDGGGRAFPAIVEAFEYLQRHAYFFKAVFHASAAPEVAQRLERLLGEHTYAEVGAQYESERQASDYLIAYLGAAQFGLIRHWFAAGMNLAPDEIALMLTRLIQAPPCLDEIVRRVGD